MRRPRAFLGGNGGAVSAELVGDGAAPSMDLRPVRPGGVRTSVTIGGRDTYHCALTQATTARRSAEWAEALLTAASRPR
jgi:hypothetical protein